GRPTSDTTPGGAEMGKVRFTQTMSLDGYTAGPGQTREEPLGKGGEELHEWMLHTRTFYEMTGKEGGTTGLDDEQMRRWNENIGAHIMGRNMFGPVRGEWGDEDWRGWWGDDPPYHAPTFVLTHHPRASIPMAGGTTFHFVTEGIEAALEQARAAAGNLDVKIGGGVSTVRQYLQAGLVDELHFAISPVVLGRGEAMFAGLDLPALGFHVVDHVATAAATHVTLARQAAIGRAGKQRATCAPR
ncbi:MAG TPA: dihydrofolate reductase family protein, partial [Rhodanobacter sp.]|nr:dihydrofolate reductase family protein [Rhodanobacter sp.]